MVFMLGTGGLGLGDEMPPFSLQNIDGTVIRSKNLKRKVQVIVFTCNHCPYAIVAWPKLVTVYEKFKDKADFVAVNPNDVENYPEDSFDNMKKIAKKYRVGFPYLYDETQEVAKSFHAKCTPDIYVFFEGKLAYRGRIDDDLDAGYEETEHELENAIQDILEKGKVGFRITASGGCSIKWKEI